MNKAIFRRCLVFAAVGAASVVLSACGGSAGGEDATAREPLARASTTEEAESGVAVHAQRPGNFVAADAGAASLEPQ